MWPRYLPGLAIELPQDAVLADREDQVLTAAVDEHALEDDVEVERLAGRVLEVPGELAGVGVEGHGGAGVEPLVEAVHPAAHRHPRFGLRRAPVGEIQIGIVAAGDPRLAAGAIHARERAPGVAARLAVDGHRVEAPQLFPGGGVVAADEALLLDVGRAPAHALDHLALGEERAARTAAPVRHRHVPRHLAGAGVERHEVRVAQRQKELVVVERHAAHGRVDAEPLLPDQIAALAVERLDDAVAVVEEDDAVVRERRRLVGAALAHRRHPRELQLRDVVAGDLVERAEIARRLIPPQHRPVAGRRVAQHVVGDAGVVANLAGDGQPEHGRCWLSTPPRARGLSSGRLGGWPGAASGWCLSRRRRAAHPRSGTRRSGSSSWW